MPYTVKVHDKLTTAQRFRTALTARLKKDGRFTADLGEIESMLHRGKNAPPEGSKKLGFGFAVTRVRLTKAKPYCGQHPGHCVVNPFLGARKKLVGKWLEWEDWIQFNDLVNDVLDKLHLDADVWSIPMETNGRMWVRKGLLRRVAYDFTEKQLPGHWQPLREWNHGTPDQFVSP